MHPQVDTSQSLRCFWIFLVPTLSSFVDYCATTPVLGGGLSPPNHTQSRTHWVNADFSDAQSDTRFEPGTLGSPVRCLDHYTTPAGTSEGIFCYNILAQKHLEVDQDLFTCFIDYSKAFDRVHHYQLIECLEKIGVDGKDIRIITELYWHQKAAIRLQDELSPYTSIKRGVRQGCVLSPYLFNIYTEFIFRESNDLQGICIHGMNVNNLRYADDTALIADDPQNLQEIVN